MHYGSISGTLRYDISTLDSILLHVKGIFLKISNNKVNGHLLLKYVSSPTYNQNVLYKECNIDTYGILRDDLHTYLPRTKESTIPLPFSL